jgi:hypothetical protein
LDKESIEIYGTQSTFDRKFLSIRVQKCHSNSDCASEAEIEEYLRDKYLLLYYNEINFNFTGFFEESVSQVSRFRFEKIST